MSRDCPSYSDPWHPDYEAWLRGEDVTAEGRRKAALAEHARLIAEAAKPAHGPRSKAAAKAEDEK